jgi:hypothetical protein
MDGRNAENAGAFFRPSGRSSRIGPCHLLVVIVYTRVKRTDGDLPTEDFHLMSLCPCRAYTITSPDAKRRACKVKR